MTTPQDKSPDRMDDAIAWSVRLSAPDVSAEQLADFAAWLEADAANRLAFERVSAFENSLDDTVADYAEYATADEDMLPSAMSSIPQRANIMSRRSWIAGGAALLAACAVLFVTLRNDNPDTSAIYATNVGEQKTVTLADGSTIELNTATTLVVAPDGVTRHVTLQRGEALFHVAKDSSHPFLVTVGDRQVRVVGTVFNVRRDDRNVTIVVAEGKVAVGPKDKSATNAKAREQHLTAGDKLVYAGATGTTTIMHVDPRARWRGIAGISFTRMRHLHRLLPISIAISLTRFRWKVPRFKHSISPASSGLTAKPPYCAGYSSSCRLRLRKRRTAASYCVPPRSMIKTPL